MPMCECCGEDYDYCECYNSQPVEAQSVCGVLITRDRYAELLRAEKELREFTSQLIEVSEARYEQNMQLHYWLDPDGGYQREKHRAYAAEEEYREYLMRNPLFGDDSRA